MPLANPTMGTTRLVSPEAAAAWRQGLIVLLGTLAMAIGLMFLLIVATVLILPGRACAQTTAMGPAARAEPPPAGLFFRSEHAEAALEAPTLKSDVRIALNGLIARVTVRQRFLNPSEAWMEGIYVFPLPERSAVDRLTMTVGGRRIEGLIQEREEARRTYEKAAREGKRASLLTSERANVFTTSVANIGPGEEIVIEIEYQDRASYEDGRFTYRFPMVVAPRYTPPGSIPLAENGQPAARPAVMGPGDGRDLFGPVRHPDRGPINPLTLAVTLDAGLPLSELNSLYHPVSIDTLDARRQVITLKDGPVPADRDFVLEWRPKLGSAPEAAVFGEELGGDSYLTIMLLPPDGSDDAIKAAPRDLIFVIDTSGSMHGPSMDQAKEALLLALEGLEPGDRFNVIRFASETNTLFREVEPADAHNLRVARAYVKAMTGEGGTNMMPALFRALRGRAVTGRLRQVVFLTDGAVGNEAQLFEAIDGLLGETRLFTIGIGSAPNSYFMRKAAELGRGSFTYIGDVTEVAARVGELLSKLERPALIGLGLAWPEQDQSGVETYPSPLPDLYAGQPLVFSAKVAGLRLGALRGELTLSGARGGETWQRKLDLGVLQPAPGVAAIWARAKIDRIEDGRFTGENPAQVRKSVIQVALRHELVTRYTSLVAVDDEPVRPPAESLESKEIERNLPQGMDWAHVFGEGQPEMKLRNLSPGLMQKIKATGRPVGLPQTATHAPRQAVIGAGLLSLGLFLLLLAHRARRAAAARSPRQAHASTSSA